MRARAVAGAVVGLSIAGSIGIVFAQKGMEKSMSWPGEVFAAASELATGSTHSATATEPVQVASAAAVAPPPAPVKKTLPANPVSDLTGPRAGTQLAQIAAPGATPTVAPTGTAAPTRAAATPGDVPAAAPPSTLAPAPAPSAASVLEGPPCTNPAALGVSRVVEIDTTGAPGFGSQHFKQYDFLRPGEVVLTFDDGPWIGTTPMVLDALAKECVRATFFAIGKHATYYPEILRQVHEAGHTVGSHTWSHKNLAKLSLDEAKDEIEKGVAAVKQALGGPMAPFFRFPELRHPPEVVAYLGERNVGIFSTDLDSLDYKVKNPEQLVAKLMPRLKARGKGILLLHDQRHWTAKAVPHLLAELKANGFKIVHVVGKEPLDSLPAYDQMIAKDEKLPTAAASAGRPDSKVFRTIGQ